MNKILLLIAGVAVAGAGTYFVLQSQNNDIAPATTETEQFEENDTQNTPVASTKMQGDGTFRDLIGMNKSITCDITYTPADYDGIFEGTIYIADGERMKADFTMTSDDGFVKMSVINDGVKGYTWGTTPMGEMAMVFDAEPLTSEEQTEQDPNAFNLDEDVTYDCRNWTVDESIFTPPAEIQFIDMKAKFEASSQTNEEIKAMQCNTCAQVPDEKSRGQCMAAFSCN